MINTIGGIAGLIYIQEMPIECTCPMFTDLKRLSEELCPRCRSWRRWIDDCSNELLERCWCVAESLVGGGIQELTVVASSTEDCDDLVLSRRTRKLLEALKRHVAAGEQVLVIAPNGITCYVLWRVLDFTQPAWLWINDFGIVTAEGMRSRFFKSKSDVALQSSASGHSAWLGRDMGSQEWCDVENKFIGRDVRVLVAQVGDIQRVATLEGNNKRENAFAHVPWSELFTHCCGSADHMQPDERISMLKSLWVYLCPGCRIHLRFFLP